MGRTKGLLAFICKFSLIWIVDVRYGLLGRSDGWRVVDDDYGQVVGKLQAESMMSTAASLFPQ
jgi:hypothetical protein